jgi:L-amino acid N-acyltransferase YncA
MQTLTLRTAEARDAEAIAEIYNHEVTHGVSTFDLTLRSVEEQRAWISARSGAFSVIVADDMLLDVVGFAALSTYRDRAGYRTTVENSIYVRRDQHRRGIGKLLLARLLEVARDSGFHTVIARIESTSVGSLALHESLGFTLVGTERQIGRKHGRWLDSAIMQKMLSE